MLRRVLAFLMFVSILVLSSCSMNSSSLDEEYHKGFDDGYEEGRQIAWQNITLTSIPDETKDAVVEEWQEENSDYILESYRQYFAETDGIESYWAGFEDACEAFDVSKEKVDTYMNSTATYHRETASTGD